MARGAERIEAFQRSGDLSPIPAAVDLIGERWTFLILRAAMFGLRHFEEFQAGLGIARNILSDRLGRLVKGGLLARSPDPADRRKVIYALTDRGLALLPVLVALFQWARQAGLGNPEQPVLADRQDHKPLKMLRVEAHDGRVLELGDLIWLDDDGNVLPPTLPLSE